MELLYFHCGTITCYMQLKSFQTSDTYFPDILSGLTLLPHYPLPPQTEKACVHNVHRPHYLIFIFIYVFYYIRL